MVLAVLCGFVTVSNAQKVTIGTNAVMWADLGAMNLEASLAVSQHLSAHIGGRYNPWYFERGTTDQFQNRKRGAWMGMRYWLWYVNSGWFFQAKAQWQEYNIYLPGMTSVKEEGDCYGGGLAAGYAFMVTPHFNIEVGLGAWAGKKVYNEDLLPERGRRITAGASKFFVLPDELCVTLVFVL